MADKKIKAVLFDLDGTLLPMDMELFAKAYFGAMSKRMASHGYDPEKFVKSVWAGTACMVNNDGSMTNEDAFFQGFAAAYGRDLRENEEILRRFYANEFDVAKSACGYNALAKEAVTRVKEKGLIAVLATNPLFPRAATERRMAWAGLSPEDFALYTTYESCSYCKPNLDYYREILVRLGLCADECLMVGNDVDEDMIAEKLGMRVFLLSDCLLNKGKGDISRYESGSFDRLLEVIEGL